MRFSAICDMHLAVRIHETVDRALHLRSPHGCRISAGLVEGHTSRKQLAANAGPNGARRGPARRLERAEGAHRFRIPGANAAGLSESRSVVAGELIPRPHDPPPICGAATGSAGQMVPSSLSALAITEYFVQDLAHEERIEACRPQWLFR